MSLANSGFDKSESGSHFLLNPLWIVGFVACIGLLGLLGLPEPAAAIIILITVIGVSLLNPLNGVAVIVLFIPFFLEAGNRPYFFLLEIIAIVTLLSAAIRLFTNGAETRLPIKRILLLFILVSIAAFPLDGKEFYYELWARSFSELFEIWLVGHLGSKMYYFRAVYNTLTGVGLFLVVAYFWNNNNRDYAKNLINAFILMAVIVSFIGMALYFQILPSAKSYLSASLVGRQGGITAFAYNQAFLVQYLSFALCFCLVMARENMDELKKATFYYLPVILFIFAMFMSRQRIAIVIIAIPFLLFGAISLFHHKKAAKTALIAVALVGLTAGMVVADHVYLGSQFSERFGQIYNDPRLHLWNSAIGMFTDNPLMGVGTGRFHYFFPEYFDATLVAAGEPFPPSINAHSFYMQTAAEKGMAGIAVTLALIGVVMTIAWRRYRDGSEDIKSPLFLGSLACLLMWLLHGGVNHIAHIRSFDMLFWVLIGFIVIEKGSTKRPFDISRYAAMIVVGVIVLAGAFQVWALANRPLKDGYSIGLYHAERLPSGGVARWSGKRAVEFVKAEKASLRYRLSAPLPGIEARPQEVTIRIREMEKRLSVSDTKWHDVTFDVAKNNGQPVAVMIETSYTYNPAKEAGGKDDRDLGVYVERVGQ